MLDKLIQADINLFLWLNGFHNDFFDSVMWFISGKVEWVPLYLLLIGLIIYKWRSKSIWIFISVILVIALSDIISTQLLKDGIQRLRPSHNKDLEQFIHLVNGYHGGKYGFVSSHAANSFGLAVFISLLFRNKYWSTFMLIWALVVSYSRIYLGVHYPGDVIGGAVVGALVSWSVFALYRYSMEKFILEKFHKNNPHDTKSH